MNFVYFYYMRKDKFWSKVELKFRGVRLEMIRPMRSLCIKRWWHFPRSGVKARNKSGKKIIKQRCDLTNYLHLHWTNFWLIPQKSVHSRASLSSKPLVSLLSFRFVAWVRWQLFPKSFLNFLPLRRIFCPMLN